LGFYGVKGGIFAIVTAGHYRVQGPALTFIEDNNNLALALTMTIPLMRYLQLTVESRAVRVCLSVAMLLTSLAILSSYSRAGFLALAAVTAAMVLKSRKRILFGATMAAGLYVMYGFMPPQWHDRMQTINDYETDLSARGRINAWRFARNLAADRPLVGGGFKTFTPELFRIYAPEPGNHHDAHSIYMQVLGEQGYPGLFLFVSLGAVTWFSAGRLRRAARNVPDLKWVADLASMSQVSLLGYAVGGAFVTLAYFDLPYHLLSLVVVAKALTYRKYAELQEADAVYEVPMEAMAH